MGITDTIQTEKEKLIGAFGVNVANKQFGLAKDTLRLLPKEVADILRTQLPDVNFDGLEGSIVDWENHINFGAAGNCFVCGRSFTREESKLIGIGPVCGGWDYAFDPRDPEHAEALLAVKRTVRQRMLEGEGVRQYADLISQIEQAIGRTPVFGIIRTTAKAIEVDIDGVMTAWIPLKTCVYYFGAFYVNMWKAKEIMAEFCRRLVTGC